MGLTVPKWVLINQPKIPPNLSAQTFGIKMKKRLHWASVVRASKHVPFRIMQMDMEETN